PGSCVSSQSAFGHPDMRDGVLVERLAFGQVTVSPIELLGSKPGVDDDHAIAAAPCPSFGEGEQPRSNAFALQPVCHRHLSERQGMRAKELEGYGTDHLAVRCGAEMPAADVVGELLGAESEPKRLAQDRLAQAQALGIELRAVRRFGQCDFVSLGHQPFATVSKPRASSRMPESSTV